MALISLAGIAAAIDNLHLNEATLKGKLLHAIRTRFADVESLDTITKIDPLDLIQELWAPKSAAEIKAKRKNLSSLKSSINKSLKEGIDSGANPEGIIIGRDNVFVISDEKKNLLLDKLTLDGAGGSASLLGTLAAIQEMLSGIIKAGDQTEALKILDQLDSTRNILTKLAGLAEEGSDGGESSVLGEDGDHMPVEEFEVDEDTVIEFIDEDDLVGPEQEDGLPPAGAGADSTALANVETLDKEGSDTSGADSQPNADQAGQGPGAALEGPGRAGSGDLPGGEGRAGLGSAEDNDWDSFEVIDEEFDIIDDEDLAGQGDDSEQDTGSVDEDLEIMDDREDGLAQETDLAEEVEPHEEIETEEVELEEDIEVIDAADLGEPAIAPDFPGAEEDTLAAPQGAGELPAAGEAPGDLEEEGTGKSESASQPGADQSGQGTGLGVAGPGQAGSGDLPGGDGLAGTAIADEDDWDSYEVVDDNLNFSDTPDGQDNQGSASPPPRLDRSLDLSQYIAPEEALVYSPDILHEHNDEYVRQIVERFMPKFIRIPAGLYPVGGRKRRKTDRMATTVSLADFYIGQMPITNDLFDFFVRETGYVTEAEKLGHGLVTSGRLRTLQQATGRHTLAISKGVITRQIRGANWRHPDGPGSSLENRSHHPVVQVSRLDAMAFAAWAGKRLPSEDEWEAAARGKEGYLFPWGNEFQALANLEGQQAGSTMPVNYFGGPSLSPFGLLDMLGNVFEWTSSSYNSQNGRELYVLKGGSWATARINCADRLIEPATTGSNTIGFRCAVDAG